MTFPILKKKVSPEKTKPDPPPGSGANCARIDQSMKFLHNQTGKVGWVLLWALGVPVPILVLLFLMRGCT
jgi:hypothetical protein